MLLKEVIFQTSGFAASLRKNEDIKVLGKDIQIIENA